MTGILFLLLLELLQLYNGSQPKRNVPRDCFPVVFTVSLVAVLVVTALSSFALFLAPVFHACVLLLSSCKDSSVFLAE